MYYVLALAGILFAARLLAGSWRTAILLPWVVTTIPLLSGAWLASLPVSPALIAPWSGAMHMLVAGGIFALAAGSFTLKHGGSMWSLKPEHAAWSPGAAVTVLLIVTGIAAAATGAEFLIAGQVPAFSADPDHARAAASKIGFLHIFSVLSGHVIPISVLVLASGSGFTQRMKRMLAAIILVNFALLLLWVARGMLVYPLVTSLAVAFILNRKSFTTRRLAAAVLAVLLVVAGVKYARDLARFGRTAGQEAVQGTFLQDVIGNAVVLYLTATLNYEILNRYVETVPRLEPHTGGSIMASHLLAYFPGKGEATTELEVQNRVLKKFEQEFTLTSTFFGIPYLEFGFAGVVLIGFSIGLLYRYAWLRMLERGTPWMVLLYGYLLSMAVFLPYTFLFTQVSFTWFIASSYLILLACSSRVNGATVAYGRKRILGTRA